VAQSVDDLCQPLQVTMSFICSHCKLEFENKNLYVTHTRKCVKTVTFVAYNNQEITVTRDQNNVFLCYCSDKRCPRPRGFLRVNALQKHLKTSKTIWLGPEKKVRTLFGLLAKSTNMLLVIIEPMQSSWWFLCLSFFNQDLS
jgi:hypothetical protein